MEWRDFAVTRERERQSQAIARREVMQLGIALHWSPVGGRASACGMIGVIVTNNTRDVNCARCRRTLKWRTAMGKD